MTSAAGGTSRAAAGMGAIAALSRAIGFVRVLVIAAVLGTTYLGNSFQAANSVSNILFELLAAGALSAVLVPGFVQLLDEGDERGAEDVAGRVLGIAIVALGGVAVVGVVAAPLIARALTIGVPAATAEPQRELITFLLRFFLPQVVLYAAGTIATAVLYARRRFAVTAAAPIGNTVVMVACLVAFREVAGPDPGLELSSGARWLLVAAGTGGVAAFVGSLLVATRASGFRLRPRLGRPDERVRALLRHSGWGVVLHTGAGLLLGGAVVAGSSVEGGVVAYQVAWVFFLAPYAVFAQPIHTAILPELVVEAADADRGRFRASVRWSLERMSLFVLPASAAMVALALPAMRAVTFGEVGEDGPELLAAALAALGVGLLPYSAFLLLSRAYYALGDSRTPAIAALGLAGVGIAVMGVGAVVTEGVALVALLGAGHTVAYGVGALVLLRGLAIRSDGAVWPAAFLRMTGLSVGAGALAWLLAGVALDASSSRLVTIAVVMLLSIVGVAIVLGGYALLGVRQDLTQRHLSPAQPLAAAPDLPPGGLPGVPA